MKILVTAGGTHESIDAVRSISNHATGRLGAIIAETFAKNNWDVTFICGEGSAEPTNAEILRISDVKSLLETLESQLYSCKFDCIVHSMAVSDYTISAVLDLDEIVRNILKVLGEQKADAETIRKAVLNSGRLFENQKLSSNISDMALLLKQAPKVIGRIKEIQPETVLVGFKLLSGVTEDELIQNANGLILKNTCDYVLANDLIGIHGDIHKGILIDKTGVIDRASTKTEIAELIFRYVSERSKI